MMRSPLGLGVTLVLILGLVAGDQLSTTECPQGSFVRYTQFRNANRLSTCEPCNCDPIGSKFPPVCGNRSGACQCIDGYTGLKCDRCSLDHYNASAVGYHPSKRYPYGMVIRRRHCIRCGGCFDRWHATIVELKQSSENLIKRVYEFSSGSATGLERNQEKPANGASPAFSAEWNSFQELDEKLALIGEKVLSNKQTGDKLHLLAEELDSIVLHRKRVEALMDEIEPIVADLILNLNKSRALNEEFADNERILSAQMRTLHLLHAEVDSLTAELQTRLNKV